MGSQQDLSVLMSTVWIVCSATLSLPAQSTVYVIEDGQRLAVGGVPGLDILGSPELSPDEQWVAVEGWKSVESEVQAHIYLVRTDGSNTRDLGPGRMPSWSADSQSLAYCRYQEGVITCDHEGENIRSIDPEGWGIQWSPDGKLLAYIVGFDQLVVVPSDQLGITTARKGLFPERGPCVVAIQHNMEWSPDSRKLCVMGYKADGHGMGIGEMMFAIIDVLGETPGAIQWCGSAETYEPDIAWHPDGSEIAVTRQGLADLPSRIERFPVLNPERRQVIPGQSPRHSSSGQCWSHDGKRLYYIQR